MKELTPRSGAELADVRIPVQVCRSFQTRDFLTPFLNSFKVSESESEVRILIKILVLKFSKLMTLFVRNCTKKKLEPQVQFFNFPTPLSKIHKSMCKFLGRIG